jgi:uncharacterized membrane protein YphA (DoxX/SURF4 family)
MGLVAVRWILGATFLFMGLAKLDDTVGFLKLIREYELVPPGQSTLLNGLAIVLPWLEIWLGLLLIAGVAVRGSALALLTMLVVFTSAIGLRTSALMETDGLALCAVAFDCGCGSGVVNVCSKLAENLGLMALAALAAWSGNTRLCLRHRLLSGSGPDGQR